MAMRCEEVTELLDAYALGALDSDEAWDVDLHLGNCPYCRAELRALRHTIDLLALSAPLKRAANSVRTRLMASVFRVEREERDIGRRRPVYAPSRRMNYAMAIAAAFVLFVAVGWATFVQAQMNGLRQDADRIAQAVTGRQQEESTTDLGQEIASLEEAVGRTQSVTSETRFQIWEQRKIIQVAFAPDAQTFDLYGAENDASAYGRYIWSSRENIGVLVCSNLPRLQDRRTFQLWFVKGDQWIDSIKFQAQPDGSCQLVVSPVKEPGPFNGLAITIEPSGGSVARTPTSQLVMHTEPLPPAR
jgi:anti-sigma factor RsiW